MRDANPGLSDAFPAAAEPAPAQDMVDPARPEGTGPGHWLVVLAASFAVSAAVMAGYHVWIAPKPQRFGMIDMDIVLKQQQRAFAELITKGKGGAAYDLASRMGPRLAAAMRQVGDECGCVLLVSSAVVGEGIPDLTPRLQQLVSIPGNAPATQPANQGGQSK